LDEGGHQLRGQYARCGRYAMYAHFGSALSRYSVLRITTYVDKETRSCKSIMYSNTSLYTWFECSTINNSFWLDVLSQSEHCQAAMSQSVCALHPVCILRTRPSEKSSQRLLLQHQVLCAPRPWRCGRAVHTRGVANVEHCTPHSSIRLPLAGKCGCR
jgi:hypothetical protein